MTPLASQNTVNTTFSAECETLSLFVTGELGCFHFIEADLVSGFKVAHPCIIACNDPGKKVISLSLVQLQVFEAYSPVKEGQIKKENAVVSKFGTPSKKKSAENL
ncbi:hypothetical protein AVEN_158530-1 [Araneus ventricosus]|uniref:Uncharacterized protein n=1 Tax=Araneus ventricosus TaxID=182803 RepID=A0A4Y2WR66_ARAVE|nr:hypothetical protein AVEN_158530-1 [Araneus ventricosus]